MPYTRRIPKRDQMTARGNTIAATMKASTAPLETLTADMLDSIAASHARRGSRQFENLLARLQRIVRDRKARAWR